ncbi:MAG TPA: hypothetical protein VFZ97_13790 [Acidimicrobiales bacterium]
MSVEDPLGRVRPTEVLGRFTLPVGAALLVGGLATVGVQVKNVIDFFFGPVGGRLVSISGIVRLPTALCLLGSVLVLMMDGGRRLRALACVLGAATGLILIGLSIVGLVGVVELATPEHGHSAILKASDAASQAVGYVTILALAAAFLVLASMLLRQRA